MGLVNEKDPVKRVISSKVISEKHMKYMKTLQYYLTYKLLSVCNLSAGNVSLI